MENSELNSAEYKKIDKTLDRLSIIWGELNNLKRDTYRNPMRCDEDYEAMEQLILIYFKNSIHSVKDGISDLFHGSRTWLYYENELGRT